MDFKFVKKGIVIATLVGAVLIPVEQIAAAEGTNLFGLAKEEKTSQIDQNCLMNAVAEIQKQENTDKTIKIDFIPKSLLSIAPLTNIALIAKIKPVLAVTLPTAFPIDIA